ncbi:MAG TPA: CHAT domain-containing protein [Caldilineae bacterium]|nr:CHAT domain-containing protein [Caldilineae bacterium]
MTTSKRPVFIDLDLRVSEAGAGAYRVTAQTGKSGLARASLDWKALSSDDFVAKLTRIREEPFTTEETLLREVGETLFGALFQGQVRDLFVGVYGQEVQTNENAHLRIRLDIDETASEVAVLPWELMSWQDVFLATQIKTLVTRQLLSLDYGAIKSLKVAGKPKVLIVIPRGSGLATDAEEATITKALANAAIPYELLKGKTPLQDVDDKLAEGDFNIFHFIGHGDFEKQEDGLMHGALRFNSAWEDLEEEEDEEWIEDSRLQALFGNHKQIKVVVLNACRGAVVDEHRSGHGFIGVAPALLRAGVPAVVAMQYAIRDDVALQFAETFYNRLSEGKWAGQVDTAVTLGRNACYLNYPKDRGFATPVLYLRSEDGIVFSGLRDASVAPPFGLAPDDCPPPPRPDDALLHDHRYDTAETMIKTTAMLEERYGLAQRQIDQLERMKLEKPLLAAGGAVDLQIEQLQEQRVALERKLEETTAVLRWKLHEACLEKLRLQDKLELFIEEREGLEALNEYVPYELKNDISNMQKRIRSLSDVLKAGEKYR